MQLMDLLMTVSGPAAESAGGFFAADSWVRFWARLHPVLVHFPIALLVVAAVVEIARPGKGRRGGEGDAEARPAPNPTAMVCLGFGALAAAAAAWSGWTNADVYPMGSSVELTVTLHRWIAIGAAGLGVVSFLSGLAARVSAGAMLPYRLGLVGAGLCVSVAGHFGGTLTYGDGYLLEPFEKRGGVEIERAEPPSGGGNAPRIDAGGAAATDVSEVARTVDFTRDIEPIFERACMECHGPRKQKGKLRLDYREAVMRREVIVPGDAAKSDLYLRIELPRDDEDVMPPTEEEERLSESEIALIGTWINEGASWGGATDPAPAETPTDDEPPAVKVGGVDETAIAAAVAAIEALGGSAVPIAEDSAGLEVHFELLGESFGDEQLAVLGECSEAVVWLNLAGTGVTDRGIAWLTNLPNLRSLHLERTAVTDEGVSALAALPGLTYLNLHSTAVTGACLEAVGMMPALERVFLWNTGVTADEVELLRAVRPDLTVVLE